MTRRAAFDLGSSRIGCAVADVSAVPLHLLEPPTWIKVGVDIELATPLTGIRKDGQAWIKRTQHIVTYADERRAASEAISWLTKAMSAGGEVVIESGSHVHGTTLSSLKAQSNAQTIAERIGRDIVVQAEMLGYAVAPPFSAQAWRGKLQRYSRANGNPMDKIAARGSALEPLLVAHYVDWPAEYVAASEGAADMRDAAGLLLSTALDVPDAKPRKAVAPGPRVAVTPELAAARKAARAAQQGKRAAEGAAAKRGARADQGCFCAKRHIKACPLFVAMTYDKGNAVPRAPGEVSARVARQVALYHARAAEEAARRAKR